MENKKTFSLKDRLHSFKYAINGLKYFASNDQNGRIHLSAALLIILLSLYLQLSKWEWVAILGAIALVLITEIINAAIEKLADVVSEVYHPKIKIVKDLAAGAVLISAFLAVAIAAIVFIPKLSGIIS